MTDSQAPFTLIAGPIVRKLDSHQLVLWYVSNYQVPVHAALSNARQQSATPEYQQRQLCHQVGNKAFVFHHIIDFSQPLPPDTGLDYDLIFEFQNTQLHLADVAPDLCYPGFDKPRVYWQATLRKVLHGSCRKPHHDEGDALIRVDQHLAECLSQNQLPASLLMMSGDQVYVDDVAGPFLQAIHQVIARYELFSETFSGAKVSNYEELLQHEDCFYKRTELLPHSDENEEVQETFFGAKRKPIFTSVNAKNHLITLSEVMAMYFMVWSETCWQDIHFDSSKMPESERQNFEQEQQSLLQFIQTLPQIRRALAHIPVYMMFDDHDVTDDWNLTREWEELAYGNPFSKRIIGNALFGYMLCQGLGNNPEQFEFLLKEVEPHITSAGITEHNKVIDALFEWDDWHYQIATQPKIVVLDTRTHRWRSEENAAQPSGLLDWERLRELRQQVTGEQSVVIVSPAPIFGVKVIEAIQKIFTFFGQALTVDAENWMAHQGTARVLLDIFKEPETAQQFVILSGDVHYSFVYDIRLRFKDSSPSIHQITTSGFCNQFPVTLLSKLDAMNQWLYGHHSPLNWFTKRRRLKISTRYPDRKNKRSSLVSKSAVGLVDFSNERKRPEARLLTWDGEDIDFR
ncbi:metallophosphoesterase family protein [Planctobacterium marinum]|uniref:alkaline phosphatase family protein n=1 Tax=Planctobacterium marinum TaxID=1631968 RepID=UPI001E52BA7D|nr:alkaline phosphatase family protein [Planctobacterium marinum]MCC2607785.1 alkaline phosphatase family protein [Planctobacterium marinum]